MRIAVIGATGNTGGAVADRLLTGKHKVRAIVRDAGRADALAKRGAQISVCDVNDEADVYTAVAGADSVYYCSPMPIGYEQPFEVEQQWARHVIDASKAAGVSHLVLLSALGGESAPDSVLIDTKRAVEKHLVASGVGYTILRPGMFMDNIAAIGPEALRAAGLSWPISADAALQPVAVGTIADVAAAALTSEPSARCWDVVGPDRLTMPDMAAILSRSLGFEIAFTEISDDVFAEQLGSLIGSNDVARAVAGAYRHWQRDGSGTGDVQAMAKEFGVTPTSFDAFSQGLAKAWRKQGLL